jgi:hypothetical protein
VSQIDLNFETSLVCVQLYGAIGPLFDPSQANLLAYDRHLVFYLACFLTQAVGKVGQRSPTVLRDLNYFNYFVVALPWACSPSQSAHIDL